jgi:hypothetical protein
MPRLFAVLLLPLAACAARDQHIRETMCNPDAGFQEGMNDVRAGAEAEASAAARARCVEKHTDLYCSDVACKPNE